MTVTKYLLISVPLTHQNAARLAGGEWSMDVWGWVFPDCPRTMEFVSAVELEIQAPLGISGYCGK